MLLFESRATATAWCRKARVVFGNRDLDWTFTPVRVRDRQEIPDVK